LLAAALIPDPFIGKNEADVQWVHAKDWVYTCSFAGRKLRGGEHVKLVFEGLDTFATVTLNGQEILR
jgi:beta-mannosidase